MLDESIRTVFPSARVACFCEWEAYAASVLLARMEDKSMEPAPIWCGDLGLFDGKPFRGLVDIVCAGLPCQPYSLAGSRKGNTDHRSHGEDGTSGPIPHALRVISECRPAVVFFENVPAWVRSGWFRPVGEQLSGMGYEIVEPVFIAASDVGASHQRERVFILAYAKHMPGSSEHEQQYRKWTDIIGRSGAAMADAEQPEFHKPETSRGCGTPTDVGESGETMANASDGRIPLSRRGSEGRTGLGSTGEVMGESDIKREQQSNNSPSSVARRVPWGSSGGSSSGLQPGVGLADADISGSQRRHSRELRERPCERAIGQSGSPIQLFAPAPGAISKWSEIVTDNPSLAPAIEPGVRVLADGLALVVDESRADQLRCSGNGVVPLQAAVAFVELLRRIK